MIPPLRRPARRATKTVKLGGAIYKIRRLNPREDFPHGRMPVIVKATLMGQSATAAISSMSLGQGLVEMAATIRAGLVSPVLVPADGVKNGDEVVTIEDIFRDPVHAAALYRAIMLFWMNPHSGLRGFFVNLRLRWAFWSAARAEMKLRASLGA